MDSNSSTLTLLVDSPILKIDSLFPVPVAQVLFCGNSLLKSRIYNVFPGENIIGRDRSSHIFLPSLHLSRFHASLYFQSGFGFLSDCNSHNGTYRTNLRLTPRFQYELFDGTEFKLGDLLFIYRYPIPDGSFSNVSETSYSTQQSLNTPSLTLIPRVTHDSSNGSLHDLEQKSKDNNENTLLTLNTEKSIDIYDSQTNNSHIFSIPKLLDQDICVPSNLKHSFQKIFKDSNFITETDQVVAADKQYECSSLNDEYVNSHSKIQTTHDILSLQYDLSSMDDVLPVNSGVEPPFIIFTYIIADTYSKCVADLGGVITDDVYKATHLITDRVRRTIKFLSCLTRGCEIVSINWLLKSKDAGKFLDTNPFIIDDKCSEKKFRFILKDSCILARSNRLFVNYVFYLTPNILPQHREVEKLIYCSGGKICNSLQVAKLPIIIISCTKDIPLISKYFGNSLPPNIQLFTCEFILSGILRQCADFHSFGLLNEFRNFISKSKFTRKRQKISN
ncbi:Mediator of DNA damage checkpoint protein 1 [Oopsacas minuta]|uniref:Mediator of DNA damage checkpoint protein 1 n=1 Tax=Oopsacas minuta TaxID=111878 RepID=A0AAV7K4Y3_9METZ|nr:Mediator of DNA damage checkpoint protein 1 [Oopsacas minuta]